ncbi:hypothetical protein DFH11DRAFT_1563669 [Phellopilus nigrolimitatus]|nr:hypothetical protein DFH11DRAFT_1563669 [Phellopilus nigrolimitatus]
MPAEVAHKLVPGAPPPAQPAKTTKKKRKGAKKDDEPHTPVEIPDTQAAALTEKAPEEADVKSGAVAEELAAQPEPPKEETDENLVKPSPVVELLGKRVKVLNKKITRIHMYSGKPTAELNDDQKKTLATLPSLEAVLKELEETRKAVEVLEAEQAKEAIRQRAEAEEVERQRVADTLVAAQRAHAVRSVQILDFIRLHSLLSNASLSAQALNLDEAEAKQNIVNGFLLGEGEVEGVPFLRLLEILDAYLNPPAPEELPVEAEATQPELDIVVAEATAEPEPVISTIPPIATGAMSFRFMQESEIENEPVGFENGAEWVEKEDAVQTPVESHSYSRRRYNSTGPRRT